MSTRSERKESNVFKRLEKKFIFFNRSKKIDPNNRLFNKKLGGGCILDLGCYTTSFSLLIASLVKNINHKNFELKNVKKKKYLILNILLLQNYHKKTFILPNFFFFNSLNDFLFVIIRFFTFKIFACL